MVRAALSRLIKFLETFTEHNNVIYNENYLDIINQGNFLFIGVRINIWKRIS